MERRMIPRCDYCTARRNIDSPRGQWSACRHRRAQWGDLQPDLVAYSGVDFSTLSNRLIFTEPNGYGITLGEWSKGCATGCDMYEQYDYALLLWLAENPPNDDDDEQDHTVV